MAGIKYLGADGNYHIVGTGGGAEEVYIGPELPTGGQKIWINTSKDSSYGAGLEMVKLWENASPASSFAEQDIGVIYSGYDKIGVQYEEFYAEALADFEQRITGFKSAWGSNDRVANFIRPAQLLEGKIHFYNCTLLETNKTEGRNEHLIPLVIYGIKGVE